MSYEEKRKLFYERLESDYYFQPAKPKVPMIAVPITTAIAELAEANKKGVTLVIRRDDGVSLVVKPQNNTLGKIEAEQRQQSTDLIQDDIPLSELAEQVVRGKIKLSQSQMRMLIELLPYHLAKKPVGHNVSVGFGAELDRAIAASEKAKLIPKLLQLTAVKVEEAGGDNE